MAYTPTNWSNGDVITAAKLNKLESGVTSAGVNTVTIPVYGEVGESGLSWTARPSLTRAEIMSADRVLLHFIAVSDGNEFNVMTLDAFAQIGNDAEGFATCLYAMTCFDFFNPENQDSKVHFYLFDFTKADEQTGEIPMDKIYAQSIESDINENA